jgi:galactose-1-phosphate uridylyltransferase
MTDNNLQIVASYVANHHERTRKRNLSAMPMHHQIIIIEERNQRTTKHLQHRRRKQALPSQVVVLLSDGISQRSGQS